MAWHWTCLMAIRSYSRQTWEWEFSQRLGPHLKGVLTRTCTGSLLTCWPCAWEPDLLLYIYQNFWSPLGTAILASESMCCSSPCQCCIASSQPCQLTHCWGQQWRGWPAVPTCLLGHPGTRARHLSCFFITVLQTGPSSTGSYSSSPLFLSIFIWDHLLPASSSLLCWNNVFSFLSSSLYSNFVHCFSDSTSKLQVPNPLQPVL